MYSWGVIVERHHKMLERQQAAVTSPAAVVVEGVTNIPE
jgi:hypothetical protein